jgi:hypothetical protein
MSLQAVNLNDAIRMEQAGDFVFIVEAAQAEWCNPGRLENLQYHGGDYPESGRSGNLLYPCHRKSVR